MGTSRVLAFILLAVCSLRLDAQFSCSMYVSANAGNDSLYLLNYAAPGATAVAALLPSNSTGLALAPSFSFNAPNPTLWTINGGDLYYYNGTSFVSSGHSASGATELGGGSNLIYGIGSTIFVYNGTGIMAPLNGAPSFSPGMVQDIVADKLGNFYLMFLDNPQHLSLYSSAGALEKTYTLTGIPTFTGGGASLAVRDSVMMVQTDGGGVYSGLISGDGVTLTPAGQQFPVSKDFANCFVNTDFFVSIVPATSTTIDCANPSAFLMASLSRDIPLPAYAWTGPGITGTVSGPVVNVNVPGTYTLVVHAATSATAITYITISAAPPFSLSANASSTVLCTPSSVTLTASGATSYTWKPAATLNQANSPSVIASPSADIVYTVTGETGNCKDSVLVSVSVFPGVSLTVNNGAATICAGGTATLDVSGATSYTWLPGNLSGPSLTVMPTSTTIYTVTGENTPCRATQTIMVSNPVSVPFVKSGDLACTSTIQTLSVTATTTNDVSWSGPGLTGSVLANSVTITTGGTYTLTVSDPVSGCTSLDSIVVKSSIGPLVPNIIPTATFFCYPGSVNLLVSAPAAYVWQPSVSVSPATGPLVTVTPSTTTEYTVFAVLGICSGSSAITISVSPTPTVANITGDFTVCSGTDVQLAASGADTYTWRPTGFQGASVTVRPATKTQYTVTGETGGCFSSDTVNVSVLAAPALSISSSGSLSCLGSVAQLSVSGADTYTWLPLQTFSAVAMVTTTATQVYTVTGQHANGCSRSGTIEIVVAQTPTIQAGAVSTLACAGSTVILTASGASNYTWFPTGQQGNIVLDYPLFSRTYTVISGKGHCMDTAFVSITTIDCGMSSLGVAESASIPRYVSGDQYEITFTVAASNSSSLSLEHIVLENDLRGTFPEPAEFKVSRAPVSKTGARLQTNPLFDGISDKRLTLSEGSKLGADDSDTLTFSIVLSPKGLSGLVANSTTGKSFMAGFYPVTDSSSNGTSTDPDSDGDPRNNNLPTYIDLAPISLFIPQGFSPDWDGKYDYFEIKGLNGRPVNLEVYNRWGERAYYMFNYDNKWDGRSNTSSPTLMNGRLPEGTYYYVLRMMDGSGESHHGFVVLSY